MKRTAAVLAVLATLAPAPVRADRLSVARDQPLVEVSHSVEVRVDDGVARYKVRRTFANSGARPEEASLRIDLAHAAAVTGLRIRARDRWFDGELMEAEAARAKYRELTGIGAFEPKDPALLQWVWEDSVHLQVFPVLPGGVNTVEYTLTAPLGYRNGRYVLSYPRYAPPGSGLPLAEPVLRVIPGHGDARTLIRVADQRVAPDAPIVLGPAPRLAWVGDGEPDAGAGYAISTIDVAREDRVTAAEVTLEINHTFSGDLTVDLVTPAGEHLRVTEGKGSDNDIRGSFPVELPAGSAALGAWHLVVADRAGLDLGSIDAWTLALTPEARTAAAIRQAAGDVPRFIPDAPDPDGAGDHAILEIEPPRIDTLDARLGRVVASAQHGFSRLEIDAAPQLRPLPRKASVVFVLDTSRSLSEDAVAAQRRIVTAYMSHVPDAGVELVGFDRDARRVFGEFVGQPALAAAYDRAIADGKLKLRNGSALERGLEVAAGLLKRRRGPTRIVAITDAELRSGFVQALAERALAGSDSTVTHLVIPELGGEASITRDDAHPLAPIAAHHHGVLFQVVAPEADKSLAAHVLGLVRPIGVDDFKVRGIDLAGAAELPASLREGTGYRAFIQTADPSRRVVLSGKIWAAPFRRVVEHGEHFDSATAAFVFSEGEHTELSREEMLKVAFAGRAVSPVTSYLATEPGVRPAVDGLGDLEQGLGLGGLGLVGRGGGGGGGAGSPPPALDDLLADAARRCASQHAAPAGWFVTLDVETTAAEIVDVAVAQHQATPAMRSCIVEAAWDLELPDAPWPARARHSPRLD